MNDELTTKSATLTPLGSLTWAQLCSDHSPARCVWMDIDGLHFGALPDTQPLGTHLWGWNDNSAWRLRLDPDLIVGARLDVGTGPVTVVLQPATARTTPDPRLGKLLNEITAPMDLAITQDDAPITFLVARQ
jgi:hypothetical protein